MLLTKSQRKALHRVWLRMGYEGSYLRFRHLVQPGPGCVMVPYAGIWLGIEPDGYTHS